MVDVYDKCPILENKSFLLRFVELRDAMDMLKVYSDQLAVPFFNSDNCHGDTFHYVTIEQMKDAILFWIMEYERKGFVRWSIVDNEKNIVIGTIELFHRVAKDYFHACGLLRLDLRSDYENETSIFSILSLIIPQAFELFSCNKIATKAKEFAKERIHALTKMEFNLSDQSLIGYDKSRYKDYWVLHKME
ncbi:MAG: N-acetyltransferase [Candidatus Galacturonibacter soehngenii]|nr:N-acetyltransferase [Candidatus Galacturonibacter soehngenii]